MKTQRAFTLVEMLIAMLIGVFLMTGIIQIFSSAKQAYRLQENLSRLQENGRLAMDMIATDIRMTGYTDSSCVPVTLPAPQAFDLANATVISPLTNATVWCSTSNQKCADTNTNTSTGNTTSNIRLDVLRSYQWTSTGAAPCPPAPAAPAGASATVNGVTPTNGKEVSYFLRAEDSSNFYSVVPALWQYDSARGDAQERVENIEDMKVFYGVDTDADTVPNFYADPANVGANWSNIVSVRVTLLAVSNDNNLVSNNLNATTGESLAQPYTFNGVTVTPPDVCALNGVIVSKLPSTSTCASPKKQVPDLRIRRVFSTTIAVRNRLP